MTTRIDVGQLIEQVSHGGELFAAEFLLNEQGATKSQLTKARKWIPSKDIPDESIVIWPILAIDTAPTRNNVIYSEESQKKSVKKWIGITFLFNSLGTAGLFDYGPDHKLQSASQVGRIFDAKIVKTPKGEIGTLVWMYSVKGASQQTDEFINKVDSGILREVSIHVSLPPDNIQCSLCKVPFKDEEKGHYPGEKFDGKMCYMETTGAYTPLELSAVACPGSVNAHVMDDDEVDSYETVPLREALGGSRQAQETIMEKTPEEIAEEARLKALAEAGGTPPPAAAPGTEAGKKGDNDGDADDPPSDSGKEAKKGCECKAECGKECSCNGECTEKCECECAGKQTAPKPKFKLFEGHCVACGRDGTPAEAAPADRDVVISEFKEEVEQRITVIVETAEGKVAEANARADKAEANAPQFAEMFKDFVEGVVALSIEKGVKTEDARAAYVEELTGLPYTAVKAIRETLVAVAGGKPIRETRREELTKSAKERAQEQNGSTRVTETGDGKKGATPHRPAFAATTFNK